eukprot:GFYU01001995.1.p1 GENE.GFYU01001995.1~~GFYU01001995.1.p1  ORF type:complete len:255 (-),score=31.24 GFYU01001995.1:430-1194(-)
MTKGKASSVLEDLQNGDLIERLGKCPSPPKSVGEAWTDLWRHDRSTVYIFFFGIACYGLCVAGLRFAWILSAIGLPDLFAVACIAYITGALFVSIMRHRDWIRFMAAFTCCPCCCTFIWIIVITAIGVTVIELLKDECSKLADNNSLCLDTGNWDGPLDIDPTEKLCGSNLQTTCDEHVLGFQMYMGGVAGLCLMLMLLPGAQWKRAAYCEKEQEKEEKDKELANMESEGRQMSRDADYPNASAPPPDDPQPRV